MQNDELVFQIQFISAPTVHSSLVCLFTWAMHINEHDCKCARISQKAMFHKSCRYKSYCKYCIYKLNAHELHHKVERGKFKTLSPQFPI